MKQNVSKSSLYKFLEKQEKPVNLRTIMNIMKIPRPLRTKVKRMLRELSREGKITRARNRYFTGEMKANTVTGKVDLKQNFGFVAAEDGDDIFLGRRTAEKLLPGDTVEVYVERSKRGGKEGVIKRIVKRNTSPLMCRVKRAGGIFYCVPAGRETPFIKLNSPPGGLKDGEVILVKAKEEGMNFAGKIVSRLRGPGDISMYREFILAQNEIRRDFPAGVAEEVKKIRRGKGARGREDLRKETIITIDPVDAKDFDDAISIKKTASGYMLGVHIADVSYYIKENSDTDVEAKERGVSVYLPDEVFPMIPEKLSNDICSLVQGEDRMTFSVIMKINKKGGVDSYEIKETVINNKRRFTYEEVEEIIRGSKKAGNKNTEKLISTAKELKEILAASLRAGGSVDFTLGEPVLDLDKDNRVTDIKRKDVLESHKIIEYFMIYANTCAADFITKNYKDGMFRIHPAPAVKDIEEFNSFVKGMGLEIFLKKGRNSEFQKVLKSIGPSPKKMIIEKMLLRTMQLAKYSEKNTGHFGLGLKKYTHFTSPIRRYADLVVHRLIKQAGKKGGGALSRRELKSLAADISEREEKAEKAENGVFRLYCLAFLKKMAGDEFRSIITKITKNGMVAELENYPVEGFISFDSMKKDYFEYEPFSQSAIGKRTKKRYRTGDILSVIIVRVDLESQKLELEPENS